jgi:predicted helicase
MYRPFCKQHLFYDRILNEEIRLFPVIYPNKKAEKENRVIALTGLGSEKPFMVLLTNTIVPALFTRGC